MNRSESKLAIEAVQLFKHQEPGLSFSCCGNGERIQINSSPTFSRRPPQLSRPMATPKRATSGPSSNDLDPSRSALLPLSIQPATTSNAYVYMDDDIERILERARIQTGKLKHKAGAKKSVGLKRKQGNDFESREDDLKTTSTRKKLTPGKIDETCAKRRARNSGEFLEHCKQDRMEGREPANQRQPRLSIQEPIRNHTFYKEYKRALEGLSNDAPTAEQVTRLETAKTLGTQLSWPNGLYDEWLPL